MSIQWNKWDQISRSMKEIFEYFSESTGDTDETSVAADTPSDSFSRETRLPVETAIDLITGIPGLSIAFARFFRDTPAIDPRRSSQASTDYNVEVSPATDSDMEYTAQLFLDQLLEQAESFENNLDQTQATLTQSQTTFRNLEQNRTIILSRLRELNTLANSLYGQGERARSTNNANFPKYKHIRISFEALRITINDNPVSINTNGDSTDDRITKIQQALAYMEQNRSVFSATDIRRFRDSFNALLPEIEAYQSSHIAAVNELQTISRHAHPLTQSFEQLPYTLQLLLEIDSDQVTSRSLENFSSITPLLFGNGREGAITQLITIIDFTNRAFVLSISGLRDLILRTNEVADNITEARSHYDQMIENLPVARDFVIEPAPEPESPEQPEEVERPEEERLEEPERLERPEETDHIERPEELPEQPIENPIETTDQAFRRLDQLLTDLDTYRTAYSSMIERNNNIPYSYLPTDIDPIYNNLVRIAQEITDTFNELRRSVNAIDYNSDHLIDLNDHLDNVERALLGRNGETNDLPITEIIEGLPELTNDIFAFRGAAGSESTNLIQRKRTAMRHRLIEANREFTRVRADMPEPEPAFDSRVTITFANLDTFYRRLRIAQTELLRAEQRNAPEHELIRLRENLDQVTRSLLDFQQRASQQDNACSYVLLSGHDQAPIIAPNPNSQAAARIQELSIASGYRRVVLPGELRRIFNTRRGGDLRYIVTDEQGRASLVRKTEIRTIQI